VYEGEKIGDDCMPITRMDMMTMAPKTNEATSYKVQQNQKPVNEQLAMSQEMNKTIQHNSKQTVRKANAENPEYRYDAKEKGNNQYDGKQRKKEKKEEEEKVRRNKYGYISEHHIDISI